MSKNLIIVFSGRRRNSISSCTHLVCHVNSFNKLSIDLFNLDEQFDNKNKALMLSNSLSDDNE